MRITQNHFTKAVFQLFENKDKYYSTSIQFAKYTTKNLIEAGKTACFLQWLCNCKLILFISLVFLLHNWKIYSSNALFMSFPTIYHNLKFSIWDGLGVNSRCGCVTYHVILTPPLKNHWNGCSRFSIFSFFSSGDIANCNF